MPLGRSPHHRVDHPIEEQLQLSAHIAPVARRPDDEQIGSANGLRHAMRIVLRQCATPRGAALHAPRTGPHIQLADPEPLDVAPLGQRFAHMGEHLRNDSAAAGTSIQNDRFHPPVPYSRVSHIFSVCAGNSGGCSPLPSARFGRPSLVFIQHAQSFRIAPYSGSRLLGTVQAVRPRTAEKRPLCRRHLRLRLTAFRNPKALETPSFLLGLPAPPPPDNEQSFRPARRAEKSRPAPHRQTVRKAKTAPPCAGRAERAAARIRNKPPPFINARPRSVRTPRNPPFPPQG